LKARQFIKDTFEELLEFTDNESQSIICNLKNYIEKKKTIHTIQLEKLLEKTMSKLNILANLNVSYAVHMRNKTMMINNEIRRSFDDAEKNIAPSIQQVMTMVKNMNEDICNCAKCMERQIARCRRIDVPSEFMECVGEHMDITTVTIAQIKNEVCFKLAKIVKCCEAIMADYDTAIQEMQQLNCEKSRELLKSLEEDIIRLKKEKKKQK